MVFGFSKDYFLDFKILEMFIFKIFGLYNNVETKKVMISKKGLSFLSSKTNKKTYLLIAY